MSSNICCSGIGLGANNVLHPDSVANNPAAPMPAPAAANLKQLRRETGRFSGNPKPKRQWRVELDVLDACFPHLSVLKTKV